MNKFLKQSLLVAVLAGSAFLASAFAPQKAVALDYTVAITTYVPTDGAAQFAQGAYPNIADNLYFRQLAVSNNSATAQTITVYDTCTSSMTATVAFKMDLPATIGTYWYPAYGELPRKVLQLSNPCITRSSTTGVTQGSFYYE